MVGCGDKNVGNVSGKVTVDGQPVQGVRVNFDPMFDGGTSSAGRTDGSGNYTAMLTADSEGVMVGKHTVSFGGTMVDDAGNPTVVAEIPEDLQSGNSTIEFEVKPGSNTFDYDIQTTEPE